MTSNQIAYSKVKEEARANLAKEAENIRANNLNFEASRRAQEVQREVAHLNAATTLQKTAMDNAVQRENAILNANTQLAVASMNRQTALDTASISAETSRYVADTNAATNRYNTDVKHQEFVIQATETARHNAATEKNQQIETRTKVADTVFKPLFSFGDLKSLLPKRAS